MKRTILKLSDFEQQAAAILAASKARRADLRMEDVEGDEDEGAPGGDDDEDDSADDSDKQGGADDKDSDDDKNDKSDDDKSDDKVDRAEYERVKRHRAAADRKVAEKDREIAELKTKLSDGAKGDTKETTERVSTLEKDLSAKDSTIHELRIQNAFLSANSYTWHDPGDALRLADLSDVEIEEDGTVVGLKEALQKLAKEKPHMLRSSSDDKKDEPKGKSGSSNNGKRKGGSTKPDRAALSRTYPVLRGMR